MGSDQWPDGLCLRIAALALVTLSLVKAGRWLLWYRSYFRFFNSLPGDKEFSWVFGNVGKLRKLQTEGILRYFRRQTELYPRLYRVWMGPFTAQVVFNHPDTAKLLLKTTEPKSAAYDLIKPWFGDGLLTAEGDKWRRCRHSITPAFHADLIRGYVDIGNRACDLLLKNLEDCSKGGKSVEVYSLVSLCALDIMMQCSIGYRDGIQTTGTSHPLFQALDVLSALLPERTRNPLLRSDWVYELTSKGRRNREMCDYIHHTTGRVIQDRRQKLAQEGLAEKRHKDFLDVLLTANDESGQLLSPTEVHENLKSVLFSGYDTTASAVCWALYCLCQHPDIQARVQKEVDAVLHNRDTILCDDLDKLDYMTMVVKETLRLHSPISLISRRLTQPLEVTGSGVTLPAGTTCQVNIYAVHHNPDVWPQPSEFRPERFSPASVSARDSHAYLPFSAGPRCCVGQTLTLNEQKLMLARLLKRFTFTLDPSHEVQKKLAIIMRTKNGMKMYATPRNPA